MKICRIGKSKIFFDDDEIIEGQCFIEYQTQDEPVCNIKCIGDSFKQIKESMLDPWTEDREEYKAIVQMFAEYDFSDYA